MKTQALFVIALALAGCSTTTTEHFDRREPYVNLVDPPITIYIAPDIADGPPTPAAAPPAPPPRGYFRRLWDDFNSLPTQDKWMTAGLTVLFVGGMTYIFTVRDPPPCAGYGCSTANAKPVSCPDGQTFVWVTGTFIDPPGGGHLQCEPIVKGKSFGLHFRARF